MGFHNIVDAEGIGIAVTGLTIVFAALAMIAGFIAALPHGLKMLEFILPPEATSHASSDSRDRDEKELAAAIGFALHERSRMKPPK